MMAAAPLMHGAAQMGTFIAFWMGATMVYVPRFDAEAVLRAIEREKVMSINITGDAMAVPLADALENGAYDLSSLFVFSSTGAILTGTVRDRLQGLPAQRHDHGQLRLDRVGLHRLGRRPARHRKRA